MAQSAKHGGQAKDPNKMFVIQGHERAIKERNNLAAMIQAGLAPNSLRCSSSTLSNSINTIINTSKNAFNQP